MTVYWFLYLLPALLVLVPYRGTAELKRFGWISAWLVFALAIGLRHEIGCDWWMYLDIFDAIRLLPFPGVEGTMDPGYGFLNWLVAYFGGEIYLVNLACGAIFSVGAIAFARRQPWPWLALAIMVPYLIIVVAMGYTRQSVALGLIFWGLVKLAEGRSLMYLALVACGALFHKTAVLMLPIGALASSENRARTFFIVTGTFVLLGMALLLEYADGLVKNYVDASLESEGGAIRVWMNAVPTLVMFLIWRRWKAAFPDYRIWFWIGILALICVPLVGFASTAVDRIALYFSPLQIAVFSRLPSLVRSSRDRTLVVIGILGYYGLVLWVWLNMGIHSKLCWVPYQTPLF